MDASYNYEFLAHPKIISGKCSLENIPAELAGYDAQKPLVIARKSIVQQEGITKKFVRAFADSMVVLGAVYDEVENYAGISKAREAAFLFTERGCDSLIALGSGAAVDLAKAVNVLVSEKADNLSAFYEGKAIDDILKPLLFVPAGRTNGRESSNTMIIDNREIKSDFLYPEIIVIDPRMTSVCRSDDVAESAAIAFAQSFAVFAAKKHNPMTAAVAHPALSYLSQCLEQGLKRPKNKSTSIALTNASVVASIAYDNTRPGTTNLLAEELARATDLSVGVVTGMLLPSVIELMGKKEFPVSDELLLAIGGLDVYAAVAPQDRARKGLETALKLARVLLSFLPASLKELNVQKYIFNEVARAVAQKCDDIFSENDFAQILEAAWGRRREY